MDVVEGARGSEQDRIDRVDGFGVPSSATGEDSPPMKTIDSGSAEAAAMSAIVPPVAKSEISLSDTTKTTEYSIATLPSAS
eukprot:gene26060-biopygen21784